MYQAAGGCRRRSSSVPGAPSKRTWPSEPRARRSPRRPRSRRPRPRDRGARARRRRRPRARRRRARRAPTATSPVTVPSSAIGGAGAAGRAERGPRRSTPARRRSAAWRARRRAREVAGGAAPRRPGPRGRAGSDAGRWPSSGTPASTRPSSANTSMRVHRAEAGAAALLGDQQPGPAGLDRGRPQVGQLAAVERLAGGLDGLEARQRAARGLLEELLLVGQREVHATASRSSARSSENGIALVQPRLRRQAEHPLADHVAQDLLGPAGGLQARQVGDQLAPARSSASAVGPEHVGEQLARRDRRLDRRDLRQRALRAGDAAALQRRQHPVAGEAQREEVRGDLAEAVADLRVARRPPGPPAAPRRSGRRASRSPRRRARSPRARTSAWSAPTPQPPSTGPTSRAGLELRRRRGRPR